MSHYVECRPQFKDREALIDALLAVGLSREQMELHDEAVPLLGDPVTRVGAGIRGYSGRADRVPIGPDWVRSVTKAIGQHARSPGISSPGERAC